MIVTRSNINCSNIDCGSVSSNINYSSVSCSNFSRSIIIRALEALILVEATVTAKVILLVEAILEVQLLEHKIKFSIELCIMFYAITHVIFEVMIYNIHVVNVY